MSHIVPYQTKVKASVAIFPLVNDFSCHDRGTIGSYYSLS